MDSGWTLSGRAFERFLAILADDRDAAAAAYEQLRARVVGLHRWWGAKDPERLADYTLDRTARKLEQGSDVERSNVGAYVRGVARMVFYEAAREPKHVPLDREPVTEEAIGDDRPASCLDDCLGHLAVDERTLVLRYYDGHNQIASRREMAKELGISATALRIRTHRLRIRLEQCVHGCLSRE